MKKRSLVAAIAMLVVSAIVLTSSTYAWFTTTSSATVNAISASITNDNGNLQIKATTSASGTQEWKNTIYQADYTGLPTALNPVSMSLASGATSPTWKILTYNGDEYTAIADATANTDFITYGFDVRYTNYETTAKTVNITPSFSRNAGGFTYALIKYTYNNATTFYIIDSSDSYVPVIAKTAATISDDGSAVAIVDSADTNYSSSDMGTYAGATTLANNGTIAMSAAAGTQSGDTITEAVSIANIEVYIWAEGQDANCTGSINNQSTGISFSLALA